MAGGVQAIIGIGNPTRGDDGVAREIIHLLKGRIGSEVELIESDGEVSSLIELLGTCRVALILDAVEGQKEIGAISSFNINDGKLPSQQFKGSTHALGIEDALELARSLETLPKQCIVVGINGFDFNHREGLSPELRQHLPSLQIQILEIWNSTVGAPDA